MSEQFKLPAGLPSWPTGTGFGTGKIQLGEIEVSQVSNLEKIWSCSSDNNNIGATFYKPVQIPEGYFTLGHYTQPNNTNFLQGSLLVAKITNPNTGNTPPLAKPVDYTLVWSSESWKGKKHGEGFFWIPIPPQGYLPVGYLVTNSPEKPSLEELRCVCQDLTGICKPNIRIWDSSSQNSNNFLTVWTTKPDSEKQTNGVSIGTFYCTLNESNTQSLPIACLKNMNSALSGMPNLDQVNSILQNYGPVIYFHPKEKYFPSSVSWFFKNGAVLQKKDAATSYVIAEDGSNLPQGGNNDGEYWIDIPKSAKTAKVLLRGDLQTAEAYIHVKVVLGGMFTDIAAWLFYPFNGPGSLVVFGSLFIPLGTIGQHVGDWEHITLRINNFNGALDQVYLSQHSGGSWIKAWELEYIEGSNRFVVYSSRNGHANFARAGVVLQGSKTLGVGIANSTARSDYSLDCSKRYKIVSAEYMNSIEGGSERVLEPAWLNYARKWGPKISYGWSVLVGCLSLPSELSGENGPTGPKWKSSWYGDEKVKDVFST